MSGWQQTRTAGVLIDGQWQEGEGESWLLLDPLTRQPHGHLQAASAAQLEQAVTAARLALAGWRELGYAGRGEWLARIAEAVQQQSERLCALQQRYSGKPEHEARMDVADVVATFDYYAGLCRQQPNYHPVAVPLAGVGVEYQREPVGVAGLITPWNFPMVTSAWKLAPALAAGCTLLLKPSELTPMAELALMEILQGVGLPRGVVNLLPGGAHLGRLLCAHPGIDKISFTGSRAVGQQILQQAASRLQRVSLELGGKSALIVRADADLELAAQLACDGAFFNAGQMCSATSRLLVHCHCYEPLLARIRQRMAEYQTGPLISAHQQQRVQDLLNQGVAQSPALVLNQTPQHPAGFGFPLTLVTGIRPDNLLWQEEIFGPVLCAMAFDDDDEAVRLANDTHYGLVATLVSRDLATARTLADRLQAGTVWLNTPQLIFPQAAWGGYKQSSLGRELGPWGLEAFTELKHLLVSTSPA